MICNKMICTKNIVELNNMLRKFNIFDYQFIPVFTKTTGIISGYNIIVNGEMHDIQKPVTGIHCIESYVPTLHVQVCNSIEDSQKYINNIIPSNARLLKVTTHDILKTFIESEEISDSRSKYVTTEKHVVTKNMRVYVITYIVLEGI